jgi:predicted RNase H-like nuclease (RuvC/YqgF family)
MAGHPIVTAGTCPDINRREADTIAGEDDNQQAADWYSVADAAHLTGKSKRTIRRWAKGDKVEAQKNEDGKWEIRADTLPKSTGGPQSEPPDETVAELTDRVAALSQQVGRLKAQLDQAKKELPPGKKQELEQEKEQRHKLENELTELEKGVEKLRSVPVLNWFLPEELKNV